MLQRAIALARVTVAVAVLFLAVPGTVLGGYLLWEDAQNNVELRSQAVVQIVNRLEQNNSKVWPNLLDSLAEAARLSQVHITVAYPDGQTIESTATVSQSRFEIRRFSAQGTLVTVSAPKISAFYNIAKLLGGVILLVIAAFLVAAWVARQRARLLSNPLVLLAATAEQIGAGQVRPHMDPSGIEEIDLVYQELERTAVRMAGRLAAERQFAADAAHQLRTPLTALSMRLEEIQYLASSPEVVTEAQHALEQIDRLTNVVTELMRKSSSASDAGTEAVDVAHICTQQIEEWSPVFRKANRALKLEASHSGLALATPGAISQILATLVENSLKYGAGTTTISTQRVGRAIAIKVVDEGPGVPEELGESIFQKGVSGGGSTGLGLAIARDLANSDGGRLELTQLVPAEFTLTVSALPEQLDPSLMVPQGAAISLGSRRQRR